MELNDGKVEIVRIMHYPDYSRVMARLVKPYSKNEEGKYVIPESELLPKEIWNRIIMNSMFEWEDIELKYKNTFVDDKYVYEHPEDN